VLGGGRMDSETEGSRHRGSRGWAEGVTGGGLGVGECARRTWKETLVGVRGEGAGDCGEGNPDRMRQRDRRKRGDRRRGREERAEGISRRAIWARTVAGLAMAAGGGISFGQAWAKAYGLSWWLGALFLLGGVLLVLSTIHASAQTGKKQVEAVPLRELRELLDEREPLVPLLGALLVYKYRVLSQEQLNRALERQLSDHRRKRRLGEILLEMEVVTESQLKKALSHQGVYVRQKRRTEAEEPAEPVEPVASK